MPPDPPRTLCDNLYVRKEESPHAARAAWLHQPHSMCAPPPSSTSVSAPAHSQTIFPHAEGQILLMNHNASVAFHDQPGPPFVGIKQDCPCPWE